VKLPAKISSATELFWHLKT